MENNPSKNINGMVSVIIPIFRVEKYINTCIRSVIMQSYKNLEIILVDDGSDDSCPGICDTWAKSDGRIKVIHKKNGGLAEARNYGLDVAKGEYILFVDGDDYIHKEMIRIMIETSRRYLANMVCCDFQKVYDNASFEEDIPIENYLLEIYDYKQALLSLDTLKVVSWAKLYRKDAIKDLRFPVGRLHEDEFMIHKFIYNCRKIVMLNIKLYYYFQRENSIVHTLTKINIVDAMDAYEDRLRFLDDHELEYIKPQMAKLIFEYIISVYNIADCNGDKNMKKYIQYRYKKMIRENSDICMPKEGKYLKRGYISFDMYRKLSSAKNKMNNILSKGKEL